MYKEENDYELVSKSQEKNEYAQEILREKYEPMIKMLSSKYYKYIKNTLDYDDILQESFLSFEEAVENYNEQRNSSFLTYFTACLNNQLLSLVRQQSSQKRQILINQISLDTKQDEDNNLLNYIEDNTNNPERIIIEEENIEDIIKKIKKVLSPLEECVVILKIQNFTYEEISSILDKDLKSINNTMQRIRKKIIQNNIIQ